MTRPIFLFRTVSYSRLSTSREAHLESSLRLVYGTQVHVVSSLDEALSHAQLGGVILYPVILPGDENVPLEVLQLLQTRKPFSAIFGILFLILGEENSFSPTCLAQLDWLDVLDSFFDEAVPSGFVALVKEHPLVQSFQLAAQVSSILREVENLGELARIESVVLEMENRLAILGVQEDYS